MEDLLVTAVQGLPESPHVGLPQPVPVSCRKAASAPPDLALIRGPFQGSLRSLVNPVALRHSTM